LLHFNVVDSPKIEVTMEHMENGFVRVFFPGEAVLGGNHSVKPGETSVFPVIGNPNIWLKVDHKPTTGQLLRRALGRG